MRMRMQTPGGQPAAGWETLARAIALLCLSFPIYETGSRIMIVCFLCRCNEDWTVGGGTALARREVSCLAPENMYPGGPSTESSGFK